jgi:hypothetical protein
MSRYYGMGFIVKNISEDEAAIVEEVIENEWGSLEETGFFDDLQNEWSGYSNGNLTGGESEEEFAARISRAIWEKLGRFVPINIEASYLEDPPTETHFLDEDDYMRITGRSVGEVIPQGEGVEL